MDEKVKKINLRAYELWERAGRPQGQDIECWLEAERQINAEGVEAAQGTETSAPTPAPEPAPAAEPKRRARKSAAGAADGQPIAARDVAAKGRDAQGTYD